MSGTWIERVRIDAFGHLRGTELTLAPGLNVLCGPNEAGKSTLLAFLRWMLFGFEKRTLGDRFEPVDGGTISGEVTLQTESGPLVLKRKGRKRLDGELVIRTPRGEPVPPARLEEALGGLSRELYFQVFAFGLDELATFDALASEGAVSDALFAAGVQGAHRLPEALKRLRDGSEELFAPRAGTRPLNQLIGELEDVQKELAELGDRPARYFELCARRDALERECADAEVLRTRSRETHQRWSRFADAREDLLRWQEVERELAALPVLDGFPEDGVARLEARLEAERRAVRERDSAELELRRIERQLAQAGEPSAISARVDEARVAVERYATVSESLRRLPEALRETDSALARTRSRVEGLGLAGGASALTSLDLSAGAAARLHTLRDALAADSVRVSERNAAARDARAEVERRRESLQRIDGELASAAGEEAAPLRIRAAGLTQLAPLRASLRQLQEAAGARRGRQAALEGEVTPAPRMTFPLGVVLAVAAMLAAIPAGAYFLLGLAALPYALGLYAGGVGLAVWAYRSRLRLFREALAAWITREQRRTAELTRLRQEEASALREGSELERALRAAEAQAQVPAGMSLGQLAVVEGEVAEGLRRAEARERLGSARAVAVGQLGEAEAALSVAVTALSEAEAVAGQTAAQLGAWLGERGFPTGLSAERAVELMRDAVALRESLEALSAQRHGLQRELEVATEGQLLLREVAAWAGCPHREDDSAARWLTEAIEAERVRRSSCRQLELQRDAAALGFDQRVRAAEEAKQAAAAVLTAEGAHDEAEYRRLAETAARYRAARALRGKLRTAVEARTALAAAAAEAEVVAAGGWERLLALRDEAARAAEASEADLRRLTEERGAIRTELAALETDERARALRAEEESLKLRISALAERYATDRVALALVETAKVRYEEAHQPALLKLASAVFATLTSGRYTQVRTPESERGLVALSPDGMEWSAERLSRGTREQLYLAFRIAAVEDLGATRVRLPVIVDDVLVNFDLARAGAAADALSDLSSRHQVLAFTCHPHMAELFSSRGGAQLALHSRGQQALLRLPVAG